MMMIDVFNHFMPKAYLDRLGDAHSRSRGAHRLSPAQDAVGRRGAARLARRVRRAAAGALARQSAARADRAARADARSGAAGERRAGGDLPQASRPVSRLHRVAADEQYRGDACGDRPRRERSRRARHPGLHQCRGQAAVGTGIPADLPAHGRARSAGLGASHARAEFSRLRQRAGVRGRDLVQLRLALRDHGLHDAADLFAALRRAARPQDHHPPHGRHDPVLRRQDRPRLSPDFLRHAGAQSCRPRRPA